MTTTETAAVETTTAPVKKTSRKKAAPKATATKATKKGTKKAPTKKTATKKETKKAPTKKAAPSTNGAAKKTGLRKAQVRVLEALVKAKKSLNRKEIAEKGGVDLSMLNSYIGSQNDEIRKKNDEKVMPSLVTLKFVNAIEEESQKTPGATLPTTYEITAAGRKALEASKK